MPRNALITDLDNTLYNFVDYFGPSFRSMVHALSSATGIVEEDIVSEFRSVYSEADSVEFSFSVQELAIFKDCSPEELSRLVHTARVAFSRTRNVRLRSYDGVVETLEWLRSQHVSLIAVTNAPIYHAFRRLRQLRLHHLFDALIANDDAVVAGKHNVKGYPITIPKLVRLKTQELKPSPTPFLLAREICPATVYYAIGDSPGKDLAPAKIIDARTIWARYGTTFEPKNMQTLLSITNWGRERIKSHFDDNSSSVDYEIDRFSDLKNIIPAAQYTLF